MFRKISVSVLLAIIFAACNYTGKGDTATRQQKALAAGDNAETSLDWNGNYEATLPCTDCPGIKTVLTLNLDHTFTLSCQYVKHHTEETTTEDQGKFEWQDNGSSIRLKGRETDMLMKVGEQRLFVLDKDGKAIPKAQQEQYVFKKKY